MNFYLLKSVVDELSVLLTGARVARLYQGTDGGIYLLLQKKRKAAVLLVSPDRRLPRLHLVSEKPAAQHTPLGFILYLRSRLAGSIVSAAGLLNEDRVAEFRFVKRDNEYRLVFELLGASANLLLTGPSYNILAVYHPVPPGERVKRPLLPGLAYVPPEKGLLHAAKAQGGIAAGGETGQGPDKDFPANRSAENAYERIIQERTMSRLRALISSAIKKALSKAERRVEAVSGDLSSADKADEYRQAGELVLANLKSLKKGAEGYELAGYDGRRVTVRLDPARTPAENAEMYFKKYKKSKAGIAIISKRLEQARREASTLKSFLLELDSAEDADALADIQSKLVRKGYIEKQAHAAEKAVTESAPTSYRAFRCSGWEILVGKSAAGNDYLTMKLARPGDLWLHAEGMPGSHVVLRNPAGREIPPDVLMKAASLAAYYSKGRGAAKVPVTYTQAKFVRKPKGAKPGSVTLAERKTVMAVPGDFDDERGDTRR